jgi:carboxypeptidase Taq
LPLLLDAVAKSKTSGSFEVTGFRMSVDDQRKLVAEISKALGFDFERGRLDTSVHPFCGGSPDDVRMTTRYSEDDFTESLYGVIHETGHAIYEQNLPPETRYTPCGVAASFGVHESQSRFMENQIGRPRASMRFLSKKTGLDPDLLYEQLNRVERSYIRTEADELTYNLHILLRTELEEALIEREIQVKDLPERWRERFKNYFGLEIPNDSLGVLQDVHWYGGTFGYFPSYSLGNLLAAELFSDFRKAEPDWESHVEKGDFATITRFLRERVHSRAAFENSPETMRTALKGRELGAQAFLSYLKEKFL